MAPNNSRLNLASAAIRPRMWGRMMLSAPSGGGKTWTSLVIADTLHDPEENPGKRALLIDTEKESGLTYADVFDFDHLRWKAPFDPRQLADTLLDPSLHEGYDVVIIDSFTHFWRGQGGTLDIADGRYTGWKDARPAQVDIVEAILECDAHVIVCCREKQAHEQVEENGRWKVQKLGLEAIQDPTFEYEVNVAMTLDMQHNLQVSKSRTNAVPVGTQFKSGHAADFAVIYRNWLAAGEPVADRADTQALIDSFKLIEDVAERTKAKGVFLECFGRPEFLLVTKLDEARTWVAETIEAANGGAVTGAAVTGSEEPPDEPADGPPAANGAAGPTATPDAAAPNVGAETDRSERYRQAVAAMSPDKVHAMLEGQALSTNGSPKQKAERLVKFMVRQAENAAQAATT